MLDTKYKKPDIDKIVKKGAQGFFDASAKGKNMPDVRVKHVIVRRIVGMKGGEK